MSLPKGTIKQVPEDFMVREVIYPGKNVVEIVKKTSLQQWRDEPHTLFHMTKRDVESPGAVSEVARQLRVRPQDITIVGYKDKRAITAQQLMVEGKYYPSFAHDQIWLQYIGKPTSLIQAGRSAGNEFEILVRTEVDVDADPKYIAVVPNFYGHQRFGGSNLTERAGRACLEGYWEEAEQLFKQVGYHRLPAREDQGSETRLCNPAFRQRLEFAINAWQSRLFNLYLSGLLNDKDKAEHDIPRNLPLWQPSLQIMRQYSHIWEPASGYIDTQAAALIHRSKGRATWCEPRDISIKREQEGYRFRFRLRGGAYATVVLEQIFDIEGAIRESPEI